MSLQRGLHHEEEDLPAFVYDRARAGATMGIPSVAVSKMETPVTYFYSETRRALALVGEPALGQAFLTSIAAADTRAGVGE